MPNATEIAKAVVKEMAKPAPPALPAPLNQGVVQDKPPVNLFGSGTRTAAAIARGELVLGALTNHSFTEFLAFVGQMTIQQIEVVALGTSPEPGSKPDAPGPTTTGSLWGAGRGDAHRWVWPPPLGFNFGLDTPAPMAVKVMHSAPGSQADESPWMSIEEVAQWTALNPVQKTAPAPAPPVPVPGPVAAPAATVAPTETPAVHVPPTPGPGPGPGPEKPPTVQ
jgi:hypothetical protein